MFAIEVENLTKEFDGFVAVDSISFSIGKGEIFGLLGPNGAGKTTTMSMLSTTLKPTSGKAYVNGFDILKNEDDVRKSIGIVFQDQSLDEELTAYENMDFHGRLYRVPKEERQKKIAELLKLVELEDKKDNLVKTYSGGMRRRLEIARGLLHEPDVLFLDEPTLGLDPQTRNHLWDYIEKLNGEKGITLILTTHYMDEADKLCNRVAIIDRGKIIASDTPEKLKDSIGGDVITIHSPQRDDLYEIIKDQTWVKHLDLHDSSLTISLQNAGQHVAEIVNLSSEKGISIDDISIHKPTLEDVFLHYTGRTIREEEANTKDRMRMMQRVRR
ncbi:ATP-binding cassette domain-containing protein [Methanolobus zinderi]|uniref:ATP-binding cassette domain-containing protein n=1 Tax=Methanolobus zinderi TaxID=536044 RepID=A0A7D5E7H5_9EURY|nr:ATP-binding cassette domain-containing protein [Methanolobus zinderi]QLC48917.1 ATP-binding cassette domain-containing protein [Methanolobus zinderi]